MFRKRFKDSIEGTVLLWTIGVFSVSLLVLAAVFSAASYFSEKLELQARLEIIATNSSKEINFEDFYQTGRVEDLTFDEAGIVSNLLYEFSKSLKYRNIEIIDAQFRGQQFWIEISLPWQSPLGDFELLPKEVTAKVHLRLDSNRHLQ